MNMSFYVGALGADNCTKKLSVISNNLANINTIGFKPKNISFSELVNYNLNDSEDAVTELQAGAGMRVQGTTASFDAGAVTQTGSQCDYAIMEPNAFFMVQDPQTGAITYTRNGHFHKGSWGEEEGGEGEQGDYYLFTENGKLVLDQNQEPILAETANIEKMWAALEGEDYEEEDDEDDEDEEKPKVSVYTFENPSRLLSVGNGEYAPSEDGVEATLVENPSLEQGVLETSGTDMARELTRLIECQRAFSYALKMVTTADEIESTINSLRG